MVRIPDRPYAHLARDTPDARFAGAERGAANTIGILADVSQTLFGAAMHIRGQRDHDLLVEAQNRYSQTMTDFSLNAEETRLGGDARGFTREYADTSETARAGVLQWLKDSGGSGDAERAFGQWAAGRKTTGAAQAARFEHGQLLAHGRDVFAARVRDIAGQLEHDLARSAAGAAAPERGVSAIFTDASRQLQESFALGVGQGLFRPEEAKNKLKEAQDDLGLAAFGNLYATDRVSAMKSMDVFGLSPAQAVKARERYRADTRADAAIARTERARKSEIALDGLPGAKTMAAYSGDASAMEAIGVELAALGDKRGNAVLREAQMYREHKALMTESANIPLPELAASIAADRDTAPTASAQSDPAAPRESAFSLEVRQTIYAGRVAALKADPAGAVQERALKAAGEGATPETLATALLHVQAADGVPAPLQKALPLATRENLAAAWSSGGARERLALFQQIQAGYGRHAPRVLGEMGLNPLEESLARAAMATGKPEAIQAFAELSAAAAVPDEDLPKLDGEEALCGRIRAGSKRLSAMRDMQKRVMPANAAHAGFIRRAEDVAFRMLRMNGGNVNAVIAVLDSGVGRLKGDNFALTFETATGDGDTLEDALAAFTENNLAAFDEALPDYAGGQKREERVRFLRRKGIWVNAPDGDGFVLFDPQSQSPVVDTQGRHFRTHYASGGQGLRPWNPQGG